MRRNNKRQKCETNLIFYISPQTLPITSPPPQTPHTPQGARDGGSAGPAGLHAAFALPPAAAAGRRPLLFPPGARTAAGTSARDPPPTVRAGRVRGGFEHVLVVLGTLPRQTDVFHPPGTATASRTRSRRRLTGP